MTDPMTAVYAALNWPDKLRPPVVLPTELGAVITWNPNDTGGPLFAQHEHHPDGRWMHESRHLTNAEMIKRINDKPFTRLRRESEVAAEVLAEVAAEFGIHFRAGFKAMSERWAAK